MLSSDRLIGGRPLGAAWSERGRLPFGLMPFGTACGATGGAITDTSIPAREGDAAPEGTSENIGLAAGVTMADAGSRGPKTRKRS